MRFVPTELAEEAVQGRELEVLRALRINWPPKAGTHIRCPYAGHADRNPSWRWDVDKRRAFCTCSVHAFSIFDIWIRMKGGSFASACVELMMVLGRQDLIKDTDGPKKRESHPPSGCTVSQYAAMKGLPAQWLHDELGLRDVTLKGVPAVEIPGYGEGSIRYRTAITKAEAGADNRFRWKFGSKARPYGVARLRDARDQGYCVIVEGESDAQTLWFAGFPALGMPGNKTWQDERDAALLDGVDTVYLCAEPDAGGAEFLKRFARSTLRPRLKTVYFDDTGAKDPSELYLQDRDGFEAAMQAKLDGAVLYTPPAREVTEREPREDERPGQPLELAEREPWPEPVNGGELLDAVTTMIKRYIVLSDDAVTAIALWIIGTYIFYVFTIFPRLFVTAPSRGAGKSTLLDVIAEMVNKALLASNITTGALFRTIEAARPTILLDEGDSFIKENETLRGIINAGHKKNGAVIRTTETNGRLHPARLLGVLPDGDRRDRPARRDDRGPQHHHPFGKAPPGRDGRRLPRRSGGSLQRAGPQDRPLRGGQHGRARGCRPGYAGRAVQSRRRQLAPAYIDCRRSRRHLARPRAPGRQAHRRRRRHRGPDRDAAGRHPRCL